MNIEKEKQAIKYLKSFEPNGEVGYDKEPYYLCYSGGKDSDAILLLAKLAGVKFEAVQLGVLSIKKCADIVYACNVFR